MLLPKTEQFGAESDLEKQGPLGVEQNSEIPIPEGESLDSKEVPSGTTSEELNTTPAKSAEISTAPRAEESVSSPESILENSSTEPESEANKIIDQYVTQGEELNGKNAMEVLNDLLASTQNPEKK